MVGACASTGLASQAIFDQMTFSGSVPRIEGRLDPGMRPLAAASVVASISRVVRISRDATTKVVLYSSRCVRMDGLGMSGPPVDGQQ